MNDIVVMQEEDLLRKGPWVEEEDEQLSAAVAVFGDRRWDALAKSSGLRRSGKSCRLRWMNYLRPNLKHGNISAEEERVIIELHEKWGNKWSRIAQRLPGRTDNEIKNYWRSYLKRRCLVMEKECFSRTMHTSSRSEECGMQQCSIIDDIVGPSADSCDAVKLMSLTCSSPYQTRWTEWMPNWPRPDHKDELWSDELCFPEWISDDCISRPWGFSLWNGE